MHFGKAGLEFMATKDFDIVLVTKVNDLDFSKQIAQFLVEGGYENKYRNKRKQPIDLKIQNHQTTLK